MVAEVCDLVARGDLGRLRAVVGFAGGPVLLAGSHTCDLLMRLAGDPAVEWVQGAVAPVEGWDGQRNHVPQDPTASGLFRFASGVMAYYLDTGLPGEFEAIGTEGTVRCRNNGAQWEWWRRGPRAGWDRPALNPVPFPAVARTSPSVRLLQDLCDAVRTGRDTLGHARIARAGTEMALGLVESHRQDGARVACPLANRDLYVVSR